MPDSRLDPTRPSTPPTQYVNLLFSGSWYALFVMLITYTLYVGDMLSAYVPLPQMPWYWTLPAREYLSRIQVPSGWAWLHLAGHGDFLNVSVIALLLGLSLICSLSLLFALLRQGDRTLVVLLALELALMGLAAAGVFTTAAF